MRRSTSAARRACAVGTTIALVGLSTGLGIMTATSASAVESDPSVSAPVTPGDETTSPADDTTSDGSTSDGSTSSDPAAPTTTDSGPTDPSTGSGTDTDAGTGSTGSETSTGAGGPGTPADGTGSTPSGAVTPDAPAPVQPSAPTTTPATSDDRPTASSRIAAAQSVVIVGDPTVGSDLVAKQAGFTSGSAIAYTWTDEAGTILSESATYTIPMELAGERITVTLQGAVPGETAKATTETAVAPVFLGADGKPISDDDSDAYIDATAGEAFSTTFRAFSTPAPTLSITWSDDDGNETTTAPAGVTFDPATGVLSGTLTKADEYHDFTVTATTTTTTGTVSSDQFGEINVEPGAPAGIEVVSIDKDALLAGTAKGGWIIAPNGDVYTADLLGDADPVKGGRVTVDQGGTLLVGGSQVDRFGNDVYPDVDDETGDVEFFAPTVTSDVASDVIQRDPDLGEVGFVSVTFPHASTHTLTVSGGSVPSTVFAVDVRPAAVPTAPTVPTVPAVVPAQPVVPAAVTTHHVGTGRLAYTGTDSTSALPWALGLVLAGVGLIGARTVRRRRAQR